MGKLEDGVGDSVKTTLEAAEKRKRKKQKPTIGENKLESECERAKVAENLGQTEDTNQSADQLVARNEAPEREKKRKLERAGENAEPAEVAAEPRKKKKKRKEKEILTAPGESDGETV